MLVLPTWLRQARLDIRIAPKWPIFGRLGMKLVQSSSEYYYHIKKSATAWRKRAISG
jgi:hypothetical protein